LGCFIKKAVNFDYPGTCHLYYAMSSPPHHPDVFSVGARDARPRLAQQAT
jgi:hypothetical protein